MTYRKQHHLLVNLHRKSSVNMDVTDRLMRAKMTLSEVLRKQGGITMSRRYNKEAELIAQSMVSSDPDNKKWQEWLLRIQLAHRIEETEGELQ